MADRIYIRTGDMPTGSLKKGKNKVDDVVSTLLPLTHQRGNPLDSIYYVMNGEYHRLFSNSAATLVANCCAEMQNLQLQIETYLAILNSGPSEFEQIDRAAKNSLTTWADRTNHAIGGAFSPITSFIGGTLSYFFLPKGLTGFFMTLPSSSGQKQKNEQESTKQDSSERTLPRWAPGAGIISIHPESDAGDRDVCEVPIDKKPENTNEGVAGGGIGGTIETVQDNAELNSSLSAQEYVKTIVREYNEGVNRGSIRYYRQEPGRCNRASEVMAFSYIGIDVATKDMKSDSFVKYEFADYNTPTGYSQVFETQDGPAEVIVDGTRCKDSFQRSELDRLVSQFENDNGKGNYSPVMLHYENSSGTHWILIVGKKGDNTYIGVGPGGTSEKNGFEISIADDGSVSGTGFSGSNSGRKVVDIRQYTRRPYRELC